MRGFFSNFSFMLQWILAAVFALFASLVAFVVIFLGGSFVLMLITHQHPENISPMTAMIYSFVVYSIMGIVFGLIYGSVQKSLLRQKTDEPWRGWLIASMVGGTIGLDITMLLVAGQLIPYLQSLLLPPPDMLVWIGLIVSTIPFAVLALAQTVVLWRHVHGAWTWVLANLVGGIVMFGLIAAGAFSWAVGPLWTMLLMLGLAAAPAVVTGFAMVWLINFNWRSEY
jgi:hypothetical protein